MIISLSKPHIDVNFTVDLERSDNKLHSLRL
jgi:hypothetical protein